MSRSRPPARRSSAKGGSKETPATPLVARGHTFAVDRPVAVGVVFLAAILFGALSYLRLPVTLMPELSYPTLTVRTEYPGAAPEEVENEVSRPIEEALGVINGLKRISSISRPDVSDVVLEFSWDTDMSDAVQDSLEKLDQVFLPEEAARPLILRFDPSLDPVMELSLSGRGDRFEGEEGLRRLRRLAELQIKRSLEPIKGVAAVQVRGGLEEEIHVRLDETELARTGISVDRVIERLRDENVNLAGGTLTEGRVEYMVRTLNEYQSLGQISETVVAIVDDRPVRVGDLGEVVRAHRERQIVTHADGAPSVELEIYKEADANMVALSHRIRSALGEVPSEEEAQSPGQDEKAKGEKEKTALGAEALAVRLFRDEGARLEVAADRSLFIESSIDEVKSAAAIGGLLAIFVLYLFLHDWRSTAIVAVSIPASLAIAFAPLSLGGVSLNIMSLGGLALGVGMLVDSSIVVLESIFRCREEGDELVPAVIRGTHEVRGAVIASILTSITVFFPMVFVEGIAGQAFGDLGLSVVVSLLASLAVALYLIPMLASRTPSAPTEAVAAEGSPFALVSWRAAASDWEASGGWSRIPLAAWLTLRLVLTLPAEIVGRLVIGLVLGVGKVLGWILRPVVRWGGGALSRGPLAAVTRLLTSLETGLRRLLARALAHPVEVLVLMVLCFGLTVWGMALRPTELLPEVHQGEVTFELALPPGTPLEQTEKALEPIEKAILEEEEGIESLIATYGFDPTQSRRSDEGEHTARFKLLLSSADPSLEREVLDRLRRRFAATPDLDQQATRPVLFSFKTPIEVEVHGQSLERLAEYGEAVRRRMDEIPALADVSSTLQAGAPEVDVVYDRERLARYGLDVAAVADRVRSLVQGREATRFNQVDRRIPIVVQLEEADRRSVENIRNLIVNPGGERPIPLSSVADIRLGEGPSEVRRVDGRRVALVRANLESGSLGSAVTSVRNALASDIEWPADMTFLMAGQNQEWESSARSLWLALALSIFLVYVIMAAQFESLLQPLVILFSIPLAFFGTVGALWIFGYSLSIVVFLGMIMLAGIVVNNAIVLVDYVNVLRRRGQGLEEAILNAGAVRLRPIVMTTATTVLGLLPMALGLGDGAEIRSPMALAVIGGLIASTALTLVIIPVLYALFERLSARLRGESLPESTLGREDEAPREAAA